MTALEDYLTWEEMDIVLEELDKYCHDFNVEAVRDILINTPTGYTGGGEIKDHLYQRKLETTE